MKSFVSDEIVGGQAFMESPFPYSMIVRADKPFRSKEVVEANVFSKEYRVVTSWERSDYFESIPKIFKIQF
jgi:hypothetical protein